MSFNNHGVIQVFSKRLDQDVLPWVKQAAQALDRQYLQGGGGLSHGLWIFHLAIGLGYKPVVASRIGIVVDALQIPVDMADNLADIEIDKLCGKDYTDLYSQIPKESQIALPALMMGCVISAINDEFLYSSRACTNILKIMSRMTVGQGRARTEPKRIDEISGEQGKLYALPLWLDPHASVSKIAKVEKWGFEYGRTWQLYRETLEMPEEHHWKDMLLDARHRTLAVWPDFPPFLDGAFKPSSLGF